MFEHWKELDMIRERVVLSQKRVYLFILRKRKKSRILGELEWVCGNKLDSKLPGPHSFSFESGKVIVKSQVQNRPQGVCSIALC